MPFPFIAAMLLATAVGTGVQIKGQIDQAKASKKAEGLRQRQANLEASRARRSAIRESIIARSQALSNATGSGASFGSGIKGAVGGIQTQTANNLLGINQGQQIGNGIFQANRDIASGQQLSSIGQGIQSLAQTGMNYFGPNGAGTRVRTYGAG